MTVVPFGLEHLEYVPTLAVQRQPPFDVRGRAVAMDSEDHPESIRVVADDEIDHMSTGAVADDRVDPAPAEFPRDRVGPR